MPKTDKLINKKARYRYQVDDTLEAGIVLSGAEVKSLRLGRGSLSEAFVRLIGGEAYLINANIPAYFNADNRDYDPIRSRKLLLKKKQLASLAGMVGSGGQVLVPLKLYLKKNRFKLLVGVGKGLKQHEKRQVIKKRDLERELRTEYKLQLK